MSKRNRVTPILIALLVAALCFTSCGASTTAPTSTPAAEATATAAPSEPTAAPTEAAVEPTATPTEAAAEPEATAAEAAVPAATEAAESEYSTLRILYNWAIKGLEPAAYGSSYVRFGIGELPMKIGDDLSVEPWLLESLEQIDDLNWRLTLRPDITFQNGKPLDAEALAACMRRQLEKASMAITDLPGAIVEATGEYEVVLTTSKPTPTMAYILAYPSDFPVYDVEAVEAVGEEYEKLAGAGIWTGPYQVVSLDDQQMVAERYDGYWQGVPPLPGLAVTWVTDAQARILAVQNGEADIAVEAPSEAKLLLEGHDDAYFVVSEHPSKGVHVYINPQETPFDDAKVRLALGLGIDYETIANDVLNGVYEAATGLYPQGVDFALENQRYDPDAAAQLLDEAGWVMGDDGVRHKDDQPLHVVILTYPQRPDLEPMAIAMQASLGEIGFDLEVVAVDGSAITDLLKEGQIEWNVALLSWDCIWGTGFTKQDRSVYTGGDYNYGHISDPELDALIDELQVTFDEAKRTELLHEIQRIIVEEQGYEFYLGGKYTPTVVAPAYRDYRPSHTQCVVTFETKPTNP